MVSIYGYFPNVSVVNESVNKNEKIILLNSVTGKTYKRNVYTISDGQTYVNFRGIKVFITDEV